MKPAIVAAIFALCFTFCSKPEKGAKGGAEASLDGKWVLTASYISPGGATDWRDADPSDPQFVKFTVDSTVTFSSSNTGSTYRYHITNGDRLKVITPDGDRPYSFKIQNDTLEMWNLMCIEGCGFRYVKE